MHSTAALRATLFALALAATAQVHADSVASSASSAGSASSGSVSDSFQGSSNSSTNNNNRRADGTYQILEVTPLGDGRSNISTVGRDRFRILRLFHDQPYLEACL